MTPALPVQPPHAPRAAAVLLACAAAATLALAPGPVRALGLQCVFTKDGIDVWAVGDTGYVWRSFDGLASVHQFTLGTSTLRAVAHRGFTVIAAGDSGKIWRSTDNGGSWALSVVPGAPALRALAFPSPTCAFAAGDAGTLLRSGDGGATWTPQASGTGAALAALCFTDTASGWAAGAAGTLLRTTNGGASWNPVAAGTVNDLACVAQSASRVWAGGAGGTLVTSPNLGGSWTGLNLRDDGRSDVRSLVVTAGGATIVGMSGGALRTTTDNGASWTFPRHDLHGPVACLFARGSQVWAANGAAKAVARSADGGATWSLAAGGGLTRTWSQRLAVSTGNIRGFTLTANPRLRGELYSVLAGTVYRSADDGETWSARNTIAGIVKVNAFVISPHDTSVWVIAAVTGGGAQQVMRSIDAGFNWSVPLTHAFGEYGNMLEMHPDRPDTMYFGGDDDTLYRSIDRGATWNKWGATKFRSPCDIVVVPDSSNLVYVGDGITNQGSGQIYRSTDGGASFTLVQNADASEIPSINTSRLRKTVALSATWNGAGARWTSDAGATWPLVPDLNRAGQTVAATWGTGIAYDDPNLMLYGLYSGGLVYLSLDGGTTFAPTTLGTANYAFLPRDRATILAQQSDGLYKMRFNYSFVPSGLQSIAVTAPNGGETWTVASEQAIRWNATFVGLARIQWRASPSDAWQTIADVEGYAGVYPWTVPDVPTTTAEVRVLDAWDGTPVDVCDAPFTIAAPLAVGDRPPAAFALAQNSPNPFAGRTLLRFDVPRRSPVRLDVFDVTGRVIATLVDDVREPGSYTVAFGSAADGSAAGRLGAGVYFARLRAPGFVATRRMLVMR